MCHARTWFVSDLGLSGARPEEASAEPMLMYKDRFLFSNWPLRGSDRQIQSSVPLLKQNLPSACRQANSRKQGNCLCRRRRGRLDEAFTRKIMSLL